MSNLKDLAKPLTADQIEFRVQAVYGSSAVILAYKDARVDMQRLDDVVGPLGWKRTHSRDNANCTVSIFDEATGEWVGKEDTGTESNTEAEKGLASDSFKRACFNWGIGRELYDYPLIKVELNDWEKQDAKKRVQPKYWDWYIESDEDTGRPTFIAARDGKGNVRFTWGEMRGRNAA